MREIDHDEVRRIVDYEVNMKPREQFEIDYPPQDAEEAAYRAEIEGLRGKGQRIFESLEYYWGMDSVRLGWPKVAEERRRKAAGEPPSPMDISDVPLRFEIALAFGYCLEQIPFLRKATEEYVLAQPIFDTCWEKKGIFADDYFQEHINNDIPDYTWTQELFDNYVSYFAVKHCGRYRKWYSIKSVMIYQGRIGGPSQHGEIAYLEKLLAEAKSDWLA